MAGSMGSLMFSELATQATPQRTQSAAVKMRTQTNTENAALADFNTLRLVIFGCGDDVNKSLIPRRPELC